MILHPESVNETHWTGKKFHGYLTTHCQLEAGYSTLMRWLHDEGFRLNVPWPDGQDEEKRKAFIKLIREWLGDQLTYGSLMSPESKAILVREGALRQRGIRSVSPIPALTSE